MEGRADQALRGEPIDMYAMPVGFRQWVHELLGLPPVIKLRKMKVSDGFLYIHLKMRQTNQRAIGPINEQLKGLIIHNEIENDYIRNKRTNKEVVDLSYELRETINSTLISKMTIG